MFERIDLRLDAMLRDTIPGDNAPTEAVEGSPVTVKLNVV